MRQAGRGFMVGVEKLDIRMSPSPRSFATHANCPASGPSVIRTLLPTSAAVKGVVESLTFQGVFVAGCFASITVMDPNAPPDPDLRRLRRPQVREERVGAERDLEVDRVGRGQVPLEVTVMTLMVLEGSTTWSAPTTVDKFVPHRRVNSACVLRARLAVSPTFSSLPMGLAV